MRVIDQRVQNLLTIPGMREHLMQNADSYLGWVSELSIGLNNPPKEDMQSPAYQSIKRLYDAMNRRARKTLLRFVKRALRESVQQHERLRPATTRVREG